MSGREATQPEIVWRKGFRLKTKKTGSTNGQIHDGLDGELPAMIDLDTGRYSTEKCWLVPVNESIPETMGNDATGMVLGQLKRHFFEIRLKRTWNRPPLGAVAESEDNLSLFRKKVKPRNEKLSPFYIVCMGKRATGLLMRTLKRNRCESHVSAEISLAHAFSSYFTYERTSNKELSRNPLSCAGRKKR